MSSIYQANYTSITVPVVQTDLTFLGGDLSTDFESKIVDVRRFRSAGIALSWDAVDSPSGTWKFQYSMDNNVYHYINDLEYSFSGADSLLVDIPVLNACFLVVEYVRSSGGNGTTLVGTLTLKS